MLGIMLSLLLAKSSVVILVPGRHTQSTLLAVKPCLRTVGVDTKKPLVLGKGTLGFLLIVTGTKGLVPGTWYRVLRTKFWYQVIGTKNFVPSTRHQVLGTCPIASDGAQGNPPFLSFTVT